MISARGAAEKTIAAICDANVYYEKWTNGWWLSDSGGEALMLAEVARQLAIKDSELMVELPMVWLDDGIPPGMRRRGPTPKDLRKGGRCDIGLIRPNHETVYGLVELKRAQSRSGWQKDMNRLTTAMQRYPKLNFAILGGFVASSSEANFKKKNAALEGIVKNRFAPDGLRFERLPEDISENPKIYPDSDWRCSPFVIAVIRKGAHWHISA
jgi:hypothetical protein